MQKEQRSIKGQISSIKKEISEKEASLDKVNSELAASEKAISQSNRNLKELGDKKQNVENQLEDLKRVAGIVSLHVSEAEDLIASISQAQVVGLLWHKAVSGSNSLWGEIRGTLSTPEKQIEKREEMAESVQKWMVSVDYVTCRGCHDIGYKKVNPAKPMFAPMHKAFADQPKTDCVACHSPAGHKYE